MNRHTNPFSTSPKEYWRGLTILMLLCCIPLFCTAAEKKTKPTKLSTLIKGASAALKANANQDAARNNLLAALTRDDISLKDKANIYWISAQLDESKNGVENRKAYLKQNYDTAHFFNTLLAMYEDLRLCDSVDALPNAKGMVKLRYKDKTQGMRMKHRRNILGGGKFFLRKSNYAAAYKYMDAYYTYQREGKIDTVLGRVAYWAALCGFMTDQPAHTLKYIDLALDAAPANEKPILQEYKVRTFLKQQDETKWLDALGTGVRLFPSHDYFFVNLEDYYYQQHLYNDGLNLADALILINSKKPIYWYTKSKLEMAAGNYEKCIEFSDSTIRRDPNYADAYYNMGLSYINLALIVQETACYDLTLAKCREDRRKMQELYSSARPCMEMVRKLQPDATERWASPLYRIYMNLNMGKEFEEIDKILHPKK